MEDIQQQQQGMNGGDLELPPGFRFHPTDDEIITYYLSPKVLDTNFVTIAIGEVDLNRSEPWDLPGLAKLGEKEWYFYCQKDRKYPTGMRTNRATEAGYWKATGKDKEIYRPLEAAGDVPLLIGMKKTLVFYKGRAPRGDKTNWVMHEFRLDGSGRIPRPASSSSSSTAGAIEMKPAYKDEWVVCRVFHKNSGVKRAPQPMYHMGMSGGGMMDQRSIPMPGNMQFSMGSDDFAFTMDPVIPFYPNVGASSSSSMMPPMGNASLQMSSLFGNLPMPSVQPTMSSLYQQMGMGDSGFMGAAPESRPSSMVSQHDATGMSPDQANAAESMLSAAPASITMDMDGINWKY